MTRSVSANLLILPSVEVVEGYATGLVIREGWDPVEARAFSMETMKGILHDAGWPGQHFQVAHAETADKTLEQLAADSPEAER